ncbi:MAG: hypothetical protein AM325_012115 [Candidatus Thorarchaeota archaeon SMTZ1-45]|nr:MAG: hypothetical protein AM325_13800 [Candidatus Thorarchaeota archaeon SMTZ1-45]
MTKVKNDVLCAIEVWRNLLEEIFDSRLEYAYAKGSAVKKWESPIDYVPVISDLDIHVMMTDSEVLFPKTKMGFESAVHVSKEYEDRFRRTRDDHLHIPRSQVVHINPNLNDPSFFLPRVSEVHVMVGSPKDAKMPIAEEIRNSDYSQIQELASYLEDLPRQTFDRVGFDFWALLRRMNWRVSPAPIRILTQYHSSPAEVWNWNRTRILKELKEKELTPIADLYQKYYDVGWELFLSNFTDYAKFRELVVHGYAVLHGCLRAIQNIH